LDRKIDLDSRIDLETIMLNHFGSLIPGQRTTQLFGQGDGGARDRVAHGFGSRERRSAVSARSAINSLFDGSGGQRLFVMPGLDLVVVNAFNYRHHIPIAILNRLVLPAVTDHPSISAERI
jgi:CubicO group peptidase (beta-lactamase class C family)